MLPRSLVVPTFFALLSPGIAAQAELVVLADGGVLHVQQARAEGDRMHVTLDNGGTLTLPLLRVDRLVADEIDRRPARDDLPHGNVAVRFRDGAVAPATPFGDVIFATAREHGLNPDLVAAVVRAESAFNPEAVSVKGARGLMQLMPATARRFGLLAEEILEPARNIEAGVRYLRWLADRFEDELPLMLAGYNAGEGVVDRYDGVPPYRETREYVDRIFGYLTENVVAN